MSDTTRRFQTRASYDQALNELGHREGGPAVLAISAGTVPPPGARSGKHKGRWHQHHRGQLMWVDDGVIQVQTESGAWVVPPRRAAWIPPGHTHAVSGAGTTNAWQLYLTPSASAVLPARSCVIGLNDLLKDLAARAVEWTVQGSLSPAQERLMAVLMDELQAAPRDRMQLPMPRDRRLMRIASAILENPADPRTRDEWAAWAGLSSRTLSRLFQEEVQITFTHWREQAVLMAALERLSHGDSVANVADALGYATPSGFIAMFRRHFGEPPARYLSAQ